MPCHDGRDFERVVTVPDTAAREQLKLQKQRADALARMLCGALRSLEPKTRAVTVMGVEGLAAWWIEHEELDRREGRKG